MVRLTPDAAGDSVRPEDSARLTPDPGAAVFGTAEPATDGGGAAEEDERDGGGEDDRWAAGPGR
ncbi:MAG TPA: hypothetical protein VKD69_17430, partial [Vicinamibacterales bacterium]|nr:hypothetical protein [Vicinamibacterales bacterium]